MNTCEHPHGASLFRPLETYHIDHASGRARKSNTRWGRLYSRPAKILSLAERELLGRRLAIRICALSRSAFRNSLLRSIFFHNQERHTISLAFSS
jgi:hypothetical protein